MEPWGAGRASVTPPGLCLYRAVVLSQLASHPLANETAAGLASGSW